jgi:hypothetical protein
MIDDGTVMIMIKTGRLCDDFKGAVTRTTLGKRDDIEI